MGIAAHTYRQPFNSSTGVQQHLLSLTNYKLVKIRSLYQHLRSVALPGSPFVKTAHFTRLMYQLDVRYPDEAVAAFLPHGRTDCANFIHFITAMALYSATHWYYKVKFLFSMFDFDESDGISFDELVIMGSAILTASCIMTGELLSSRDEVTRLTHQVFGELQGEKNQIALEALFKWVMREPETMRLLAKNEPQIRYREDERVFEGLHSPLARLEANTRTSIGQLSNRKMRKGLSDKQSRMLREIFTEMDMVGSGKVREKDFLNELVSRRVASSILKKILPCSMEARTLPEMFAVIEPFANHLKERALRKVTAKKKLLLPQKVEEYRRLFHLLDVNCNGAIDAEELRKGLEYHSSTEVLRLLSQYDFDENKELQFYEFLRMVAPEEYAIPQDIIDEYNLTSPKFKPK